MAGELDALSGHVDRVYLHLDMDALDSGIGWANQYAAAGGPTVDTLLAAIHEVFRRFQVDAAASPALQVALDYYQAWTNKDLDKAMSYIAEDIVCEAPAGRIEGAEAYRPFLAPFVQMLVSSGMIAAFGDNQKALMMYDTETVLVKSAPGAECVTVQEDKITLSRFIFDRAQFQAARGETS